MNSKRCASLLRFVVDAALEGKTEHFKERTLGVEVFQREPDYDTNREPVVRTTAVEIRKRLAQYYSAPEHEREIRISFPSGSYIPEFKIPSEWVALDPAELSTAQPLSTTKSPAHRWVLWCAAAAAAVLMAGAIALKPMAVPVTAFDRFWAPILASPDPVLFVVGSADPPPLPQDPPPVSIVDLQNQERVAFSDAATLSHITGAMVKKAKPFRIRLQQSAILDDLREGPVILIGAFSNKWTLRLTDQVRYGFIKDSVSHTAWISDRQNPSDRKWLMSLRESYRDIKEDYALVSRVLDSTTRGQVVTAAGISKFGTAAAGEFLSEPGFMEEAMRSAPSGWERKNIQIVLATSLVGESPSPPRVIATYFW